MYMYATMWFQGMIIFSTEIQDYSYCNHTLMKLHSTQYNVPMKANILLRRCQCHIHTAAHQ